jgi:hypothetical protein
MPKNTDTNTTVTEISISKDQVESIQAILNTNVMRSVKKDRLLALTGLKHLLCCVCGQVSSPLYQVRYSGIEYMKFEVYCDSHIESVYQNTKDSTSEELAAKYNCQIGDIDHTKPNPWD